MNAREIIDALTDILAEILVLNKSDIRPSRKLVDDLDADSIAFLELTYRLRRDFGLRVPEAKVDEETLRLPSSRACNAWSRRSAARRCSSS